MHGEIYGNLQRTVAIQPSQKPASDFSTQARLVTNIDRVVAALKRRSQEQFR